GPCCTGGSDHPYAVRAGHRAMLRCELGSALMSIMGTRVVRVEDPVFLTRGATYTDDLTDERLTGALHLTFVRSPMAHARITGVDATAARDAPGVVDVVTAAEMDLEPFQGFPAAPVEMSRPW